MQIHDENIAWDVKKWEFWPVFNRERQGVSDCERRACSDISHFDHFIVLLFKTVKNLCRDDPLYEERNVMFWEKENFLKILGMCAYSVSLYVH